MNSISVFWTIAIVGCLISSLSFSQEKRESIMRGKSIYLNDCITCHMADGLGITGAFPPLVDSDYFKDDISKAVDAILNGLTGELEVNGTFYYGEMPPAKLTDQQVADILNYIQNALNKKDIELTEKDIQKMKGIQP